ncbi:SDR family NAD(P)-dependent oxidoreductase [Flavobacterium sp. MAH-1]|uniref:SDR family NAD(P)-dependent oxidoreductase n=1 Tax=Flavobacterium agri TaxID=2743471 RepID=A0A7Y8XYZ3_9FLAO|nr:SDR family NAD(P)-dependent oxidoreductase [Flavobacterium agri]NUY79509.1 SDR family NAD(P)-dependent oxidoreductase [Flavobacterium agri]NYA69534.1 SDR family NAD(P)-dependent oxidoreductase [Flavobacterium agri]
MKTSKNTILITGGGSGIGFEMAKLFSANGNKVIITGRSKERLEQAISKLPGANYIQADVTKAEDVDRLVQTINIHFSSLNILINNAGNAQYYRLTDENANAFDKAQEEITTNYLSTIRLTEKLLALLQKNGSAAIANVSSIVGFVPTTHLPTYSASKAALHSYTRVLRHTLERDNQDVKVFELMPPLVNTEFSKAIGGENGMDPKDVALALANGFEQGIFEIRPGITEELYTLYLSSPEAALAALNN